MSRANTLAACLGIGIALHAAAARGGDEGSDGPQARRSIYRLSLITDLSVTALGAFGTAAPFLLSTKIVDPTCPCLASRLNFLDRGSAGNHSGGFSTVGDVTVGLAVLTPLVAEVMEVRDTRTFVEDVAVYAETMAVNGGLMTMAKFVVQRPTPRAYSGDPAQLDQPGGYLSFYSGHTSFAFAALSFWSVTLYVRHGWWAPWLVTGGAGTLVATSMVLAGAHFPTDVAMGALAGTFVGVAVPVLHLRTRGRARLAFLPGREGQQILALGGRF
jgi:membrane-associated phospholipid phosphatase